MKITDSLTLDASGLSLTRDGYLVGDAKVARAGNVQAYLGSEIGLTGEDAGKTFGVYRDPDVVFDEKSMLSLAGRPVTRGHPSGGVTADNWKSLAVGQVGGVIRRDGEHVVAPMAIMDAAAAKEVASGARALSAGYTVDITADAGTAPDGTPYQFRQSGELRFNHVAYLPDNNPRAGNTRIGDGTADDAKRGRFAPLTPDGKDIGMADTPMKTVVLGDQAVQVAASDAQLAEAYKASTAKQLSDAKTAHDAAIAAKDAELAARDAQIDALKAKIVDGAALDALVAARSALIAKAKAIAPAVLTDGKSAEEIRKAAVVAVKGAAMADKSEAYIAAAFDLLADAAPADPAAKALADMAGKTVTNADDAYAARSKTLSDAWKTPGKHKEAV